MKQSHLFFFKFSPSTVFFIYFFFLTHFSGFTKVTRGDVLLHIGVTLTMMA